MSTIELPGLTRRDCVDLLDALTDTRAKGCEARQIHLPLARLETRMGGSASFSGALTMWGVSALWMPRIEQDYFELLLPLGDVLIFRFTEKLPPPKDWTISYAEALALRDAIAPLVEDNPSSWACFRRSLREAAQVLPSRE